MSQTRMMAKRLILWAEDRGESLSREGTDLLRSTDKKDKRKRGYSYMPVRKWDPSRLSGSRGTSGGIIEENAQ